MKQEPSTDTIAIPPALLAEIRAEAEAEHRHALDVLQDAVKRYVAAKHGPLPAYVRRSRAVADMTEAEIAQIAASRMSPEHDHLNALLDEESHT